MDPNLNNNPINYTQAPRSAAIDLLKKKYLVVVGLVILLVILVHWMFYTSTISVSISGGQNGTVSYSLKNQKSQKAIIASSNNSNFSKRVPKGSYEISLNQAGHTYFAIVETKPFLGKTNINATLQAQKSRQFVGNNPDSCTQYINKVLISYGCGDGYGDISIHMPATAQVPTYKITKPGDGISGNVLGFVNLSGQTWALLLHPDQDAPAYYSLDSVNNDLSSSQEIRLNDLSSALSYSIVNYKSGFLAYSSDFKHLYYYPSLDSSPRAISLAKPSNLNSQLTSLAVSNDGSIAALYSAGGDTAAKTAESEVIVNASSSSKSLELTGNYSTVYFDGVSQLGLLGAKDLYFYSINGSKPQLKASLTNASAGIESGSGFLVVNRTGILSFDPSSNTGHYEYVFGSYKFNSAQTTPGGYVLTLTNSKANKVALYVDQSANDTDSVDQKVDQLQKVPGINNVSAYGKYIYVEPRISGQPVYQPAVQGYAYNPADIKKANDLASDAIKKSGLDTSAYRIVNIYQ